LRDAIYITSSGRLSRQENTLCFESEKGKKFLPITSVSSIYLFGEVDINKRLLEFLSRNEITLHVFNYYGFYQGSFYPRTHYNSGYMVLKQAEHYLDREKRLWIAARMVEGSILNMARVLKYYSARGADLRETLKVLEAQLGQLDTARTPDELRGIEGNARKAYYQSFNRILHRVSLTFEGRTRRPPRTRLDCMISFGNSLLYTTVLSEIYKTHLDPRIGFLHETNFRRFSLNLDVADVFKPAIVDRTIFSMINRSELKDSFFMKEVGGIFLTDRGRAHFLSRFEQKLSSTIRLRESKRKVSYRRLIRIELYKIERHLMEDKPYEPFTMRW